MSARHASTFVRHHRRQPTLGASSNLQTGPDTDTTAATMATTIRRLTCPSCASALQRGLNAFYSTRMLSCQRAFGSSRHNKKSSPKVKVADNNEQKVEEDDDGDHFSRPIVTDEGVIVHQHDPSTASSGPGLTWGSVLWPSGTTLAKLIAHANNKNHSSNYVPTNNLDVLGNIRSKRILELGCGTGVVGLTCAKLGAKHVTLSDSESALWPIIRRSLDDNRIPVDNCRIHQLDWRDPTTFLDPVANEADAYDLVVAADVLYAGMQGLFARVLASHLPSGPRRLLETSSPAHRAAVLKIPPMAVV